MPAKSKAQQRFMAMAEHGVIPAPEGMTKDQMHDFASTPSKGLPEHVRAKQDKRMPRHMGGHKVKDVERGWS